MKPQRRHRFAAPDDRSLASDVIAEVAALIALGILRTRDDGSQRVLSPSERIELDFTAKKSGHRSCRSM